MSADRKDIDPHFDAEHGIPKNLPLYIDQAKLDRFEAAEAADAIIRLVAKPIRGSFDRSHLKQIHSHIFRHVYSWAGEFRQVNIHREGSYYFGAVQFIEPSLDRTFAQVAAEKLLKHLDAAALAGRAAYYLGELNAIHPFREGNGRAQREFIRELAAQAGHRINWGRISRTEMYAASIESHQYGRNGAFAAVIRSTIEPKRSSS